MTFSPDAPSVRITISEKQSSPCVTCAVWEINEREESNELELLQYAYSS